MHRRAALAATIILSLAASAGPPRRALAKAVPPDTRCYSHAFLMDGGEEGVAVHAAPSADAPVIRRIQTYERSADQGDEPDNGTYPTGEDMREPTVRIVDMAGDWVKIDQVFATQDADETNRRRDEAGWVREASLGYVLGSMGAGDGAAYTSPNAQATVVDRDGVSHLQRSDPRVPTLLDCRRDWMKLRYSTIALAPWPGQTAEQPAPDSFVEGWIKDESFWTMVAHYDEAPTR